ncbi:hypothetical protein ONZ45_g9402 [Pleurotus djamor]|nr:hypothetical protein ONZ45_g9402 [Pleurotus djamor]
MAAPSRITPVIKCSDPECLGTMGSLRVYKGTGAGREHQRGSIVQTCSVCHWTKFHTAPYHLPDAEEFVNRFLRGQSMDGLVLRPNVPVPVIQLTQAVSTQPTLSTLCSNASCVTQSGTLSKGNQKCTENMCRKCCVLAYQQASANGTGRRHCQPHAQPEVASEHTQALPPPAIGPTVLHAPPTQFQPPSTRPPIPATQDRLPPTRPPAPAPATQPQQAIRTPTQAQAIYSKSCTVSAESGDLR